MQTANQYETEVHNTTSTGAVLSADLGFDASYVRLVNAGTLPLRYTVQTSVASTSDAELEAGEVIEVRGMVTSRLGLMTTSTSTDLADRRRVRIVATGG